MNKEERKEAREHFASLCDECLYIAVEEYMYRSRINSKLAELFREDCEDEDCDEN